MNGKLIGILAAEALLLLIGVPSISAQTALKATVPFAFTGKTELPAGTYHHRVLKDHGFMDKNFGVGFFLFDRLFGTLPLQQPPFNHRGYAVAREKFIYLEEQRDHAPWLNTNDDSRTKDNDAVLGNSTQENPY